MSLPPLPIKIRDVRKELSDLGMTPYLNKVGNNDPINLNTGGGSWNNTTDPLTVTLALPAGQSLNVDDVVKVQYELMRVTVVSGTSYTFARGEQGTTVAAHADGLPIYHADTDTLIAGAIREATSHVENQCQNYIIQRVIKSHPLETGLVRGVDYDVVEDQYDYVKADFVPYGYLRLRKRPIVGTLQRLALKYSETQPTTIVTFPDTWQMIDRRMGLVYIEPLVGLSTQQISALLLLPITGRYVTAWETVPLIVGVDYTAGFLPKTFNPDTMHPMDSVNGSPDNDIMQLLRGVRYLAAADMLRKVERAIMPGGGGLGGDGLEQSFPQNRFLSEIQDYETKAQEVIDMYNGHYAPIRCFTA